MRHILKPALLAAALLVSAALPALAEDDACETLILPRTLEAIQTVIQDGTTLAEQAGLMDGYVQQCPDHAWINVLGGELDMMIFKGLREANGGVPTQDGVNYLMRAFLRSNVFQAGSHETRNDRYNIITNHSSYNRLEYSIASGSRRGILDELATLARAGTVHPYLAGKTPPVCGGWLTADTQTISYQIKTPQDMVLLPFVEAAAEACRGGKTQSDRFPLALKAKAYMTLIEKGAVTDPAEIERILIAADQDATAFLGQDAYRTLYFDEGDAKRLVTLLRKYGVHAGPGEAIVDRALWFTREYIGSEVAIRSIVYSLDDYWTPLAAGDTEAPGEEVARARNRMTAYLIELNKEGAAAGFKDEASAMLREAVTAFHKREIISPKMESRKDMPPFLYDIVIRILTPT